METDPFEERFEQGKVVLSMVWDADRPGGLYEEYILEYNGFYFPGSSYDYEPEGGPYLSIQELLESEENFGWMTSAFKTITCESLSAEELVRYLNWEPTDYPFQVLINGEVWVKQKSGEMVRKP